VDQHPPGIVRADAARTQIKNGFIVQLPDRRAVCAFYVVGVNFQLRLGVRCRVIGEQQVFVRLLGVGLLRDFLDQDPPVKDAPRFVVEDAVKIFVAGAMGLGVLDNHVMVGKLLTRVR